MNEARQVYYSTLIAENSHDKKTSVQSKQETLEHHR